MNKELLFAQTLEKVKTQAKEQGGCISKEQISEAFAGMGLSGEQLALVEDYLIKHKIGIGEPVNADDYLTEEEINYLDAYLEELKQIESVSEGEKEAITLSAMAGDSEAQSRLAELYLPQVVEIAKLYTGQGVYLEDLIGEGNVAVAMGVAMLGALEHACEAEGMLGRMIMDAMEDFISVNLDEAQKDKRVVDKVNEVLELAKALAEELQRKVTVGELAAETKLSEDAIREALRMSGNNIEYIEAEG